MADASIRERFGRNASSIASTVVTGTWLAALLLDFGWWLPFMLFGYIVIVPVVSLLFGEEEDEQWTDDDPTATGENEREAERERGRETGRGGGDGFGDDDHDLGRGDTTDALDRLRTRYANGDLSDEQFERKLDRLLETETPEDAAEYVERSRETGSGSERGVERERDP